MKLKIDPELVTMRDQVGLESGSATALVEFLVKFAVDDTGEPVDEDEAREFILDMTGPEVTDWTQQIVDEMNEAAIPQPIARNSKTGVAARGRRRSG